MKRTKHEILDGIEAFNPKIIDNNTANHKTIVPLGARGTKILAYNSPTAYEIQVFLKSTSPEK